MRRCRCALSLLPPGCGCALALGEVLAQVYQRAAYARRIDYTLPVPPPLCVRQCSAGSLPISPRPGIHDPRRRIGRIKGILSRHPGSASPSSPRRRSRAPSSFFPAGARLLSVPNAIERNRTPSPALPNVLEVAVNHGYPYLLGQPRLDIGERRQPDAVAVIISISPTRLTPCPTAHTADSHIIQGGMGKERICQHRWC